MLECYTPVGSLMFTDTGVKQRFPLPIALSIGCVMLPLFFLFFFFLSFLSVLLCSLLSGLSCATYVVCAKERVATLQQNE